MKLIKQDDVLGKGAFSTVYKTSINGVICAIKYADEKENSRKYIRHEVQILKELENTTHCLKMISYKVSKEGYIAYELLNGKLSEMKNLSSENIKKIANDFYSAIKEMHSCGVVHCDLKPENIMFLNGVLKIIDFGNSLFADELMNTRQTINTLYYRPPEYIIGAPLDYRVDYWAFGCIIMELLIGRELFIPVADNDLRLHANMLGQMILTFGDFSDRFIASGTNSGKYFDLKNKNIYRYKYLLGDRTSLYKILKKHGYSEQLALEWTCYLLPFFNRN